jgi:hypothetical protein
MATIIKPGKNNPAKHYYHVWLIGIIIAVIAFFKKYYKQINFKKLLIYFWITLLASFFWQMLLNYYDACIPAWMFYDKNIIINILVLGGVLEDIMLFHPFGMLFGYFLAKFVFKIYSGNSDKTHKPKIYLFICLFVLIAASCFIDYAARMSAIIFALPGFLLLLKYYKTINFKRFIIYIPVMLLFVFTWDFTSVVVTEYIGNEYWRAWFYIYDGSFSSCYSSNPAAWFFGRLPVSIDVFYPLCGMILQAGLGSFLEDKI